MRMYDLIEKKKLGMELTTDEIRFMMMVLRTVRFRIIRCLP